VRIRIELKETSQPIEITDALNAYTKGPLFCVYREGNVVDKYPVTNIWRVREQYADAERTAFSIG
jgi:hypothetical protein